MDENALAAYDGEEYRVVPAGEELERLLDGDPGGANWENAGEYMALWREGGTLGYDRDVTVQDRLHRRLSAEALNWFRSLPDDLEMTVGTGRRPHRRTPAGCG